MTENVLRKTRSALHKLAIDTCEESSSTRAKVRGARSLDRSARARVDANKEEMKQFVAVLQPVSASRKRMRESSGVSPARKAWSLFE